MRKMRIFSGLDKGPIFKSTKPIYIQRHKNWTLRNLTEPIRFFSADYKFRSMLRERMNLVCGVWRSCYLWACHTPWQCMQISGCTSYGLEIQVTMCSTWRSWRIHLSTYIDIKTHTSFSSRSSTTAVQNGNSPKAKPEKKPRRMLFDTP